MNPDEAEAIQRLERGEPLHVEAPARQAPSPQPQIEFSDEHRATLANAFVEAQLAVLAAVGREAQRTDSYDGPRNVARLTQALSMLRMTAGGGPAPGWYAGPPGFFQMDEEGEHFEL